ncbi:MAG: family 16 glycosylhydrolase [Cyclobacteriaceae bacterium]
MLRILLFFASTHLLFSQVKSQSDGQPRGAYLMPYHRYEAEEAQLSGNAVLYHSTEFRQEEIASEASNQKYVGLPDNNSSVSWTLQHSGNGITIRFTMPDGVNGEGENGAIDLYVDNQYVKTINITSYWAWQYFPTSDPDNTPAIRPRMKFDEIHFLLDNDLQIGQSLKLVKTNGDSFEYGIDFMEIEEVEAAISKPTGYISVTDHGAVANDGIDDHAAFVSAMGQAASSNSGIYIPAGTFNLSKKWHLWPSNISITGAGMWYTELFFTTEAINGGGIYATGATVDVGHFYVNTVNDQRFINGQYVNYKGFSGHYGANSSIHDVWITHFETGAWIADYTSPIEHTEYLTFTRNRIRNNYADGINLSQGTSNSTVSHCDFRSNGDDAMAVWTSDGSGAQMGVNNTFHNNTVEMTYRAGGAAIFGGDGHKVHHCIIKDGLGTSGLRLTTDFSGYHFQNTTEIKFYEITIENCGTSYDLFGNHRASIDLKAPKKPVSNITFDNIDIINSQRHAVQLSGTEINVTLSNINIDGTGLDPYSDSNFTDGVLGTAFFSSANGGTTMFSNFNYDNVELDTAFYLINSAHSLVFEEEVVPTLTVGSYLLDFGPNDGSNGNNTSNPDSNGRYWHNVNNSASGSSIGLKTFGNQSTNIQLTVNSGSQSNGILNGGLLSPQASLLDTLAIATATQDYFYNTSSSSYSLSNLDLTKLYSFSFFGSRNVTNTRITEYVVSGMEQTSVTLQTSGTDLGGTGYHGNNSTIATVGPVKPDANGEILITVNVSQGGFAYLNMMKIDEKTETLCTNGATGNSPGEQFTLVWQDEFDVDGAICSENWHHQTQLPAGGSWYNGEVQHYTDRTENAIVDNGALHIIGRNETFTDQGVTKNYTSARLNSKFAFTYGKVEVRAKLPTGLGTWPAIWMLGKNINEDGGFWDAEFGTTNWPACGEIDIMEHWGHNQNVVQSAMHTPSSSGSTVNKGGQTIPTVSSDFHIYQLEWTPEKMVFSVDDVVHYTYNPEVKDASTWPFDADQYLLLNFAFLPSIETSFTQDTLSVDYVRVYQKSDYSINFPEAAAADPTVNATEVVSIYSHAYADLTGINYNPDLGQTTTYETFTVSGNDMLRFKNFDYQGIEFNQALDLSAKTHLHLDLWTKDADNLKVSVISNYGDTREYLVGLTPINQLVWNSYNIPLTDFSGAGVPLDAIIQLKLDGKSGTAPSEIFVDNIYFYNQTTPPDAPVTGPGQPVEYQSMISLFSDHFTNAPMDTWLTAWSVAAMDEVSLSGNNARKYYNLDYAGIEMTNNQIDLTNMSYVHIDYWTPDAQEFGFKLVDFGADGVYSPQVDDSEDYAAMDPLVTHEWASVDIPLSQFTKLQNMNNIAQIILVGKPVGAATVYIDNVYFHNNQPVNLTISTTETANRNIICENLTVTVGNTLTISPGYSLTIQGNMDIQGELIIESGASLITFAGNQMDEVTIRRNTRYADGKYSFVGSPIEQSVVNLGSDLGSWVYEYDESVSYGSDGLARWKDAMLETLKVGKGYAQAGQKEIVFQGTPNSGTITYSGSFTERDDINDGWNLVSNPYPAAIDLKKFLAKNVNTTGAVYVWDDHSSNTEQGNNSDYLVANAIGVTSNSRSANQDRFNGSIGSMQGFFVKLIEGARESIVFEESMREIANNEDLNFFRVTPEPSVRLSLTNVATGTYKEIIVGIKKDATTGVDPGYDAHKMYENNALSFYSLIDTDKFIIQGLPEKAGVSTAIGYSLETTSELVINVEEIIGDFVLRDKLTHETYDLNNQKSIRIIGQAGVNQQRFLLTHDPSVTLIDEGLNQALNFSLHQGDLTISANETYFKSYAVYDLLGRTLRAREGFIEHELLIQDLQQGELIILRLETSKGIVKRKIFIH